MYFSQTRTKVSKTPESSKEFHQNNVSKCTISELMELN